MKKTINGKSYNTEYDSELVCNYSERVDGWAFTRYWIYKKKSTGEYFVYSKWGQWNDSWDIKLISEEDVMEVVKEVKSGMTHKYVAMMAPFPGSKKKGCYFWGTTDDEPWDKKNIKKRKEQEKERKEQEKKELEERRNRILEEEKKEEAAGKQVKGVMEITKCSEGNSFKTAYKKEVPADKVGKVLYYNVNYRLKNSNFGEGEGHSGWYKYSDFVVQEGGDKVSAKKLFMEIIDEVVKEKGDFDAVMKGGEFVMTPENRERVKEIRKRIEERNRKAIWGEEC